MKSNLIFKLLFMCAMFFTGLELEAQDWPNLERFRAENAALALPAAGENRVVFMGNSITQGWIEKRPEFFANHLYTMVRYKIF